MGLLDLLEHWLLKGADAWVARQPRRPPRRGRPAASGIVAHRGVYDNRRVYENTLAAFERFEAAGGWGIEFDVRWTRDGVPVVTHDPDGRRLFGIDRPIAEMDLETLQRRLPLVPTLAEVVTRFGGRLHLMVEIKSLPAKDGPRPAAALERHFEHLMPSRDYHLLSLNLDLLQRLEYNFTHACVPIARIKTPEIRRTARTFSWGGVAGHFALMRNRQIDALHRDGLMVGTGFVNSPNCAYRELERGVDWLFSDRPLLIQRTLSRLPPAGSSSTW
jgi:glycerophosphoryl diester phosphodiesterase